MKDIKIEVLKQAIKDYEELETLINNESSLEDLCDKLGGHNKDLIDTMGVFDLNFKSITATIGREKSQGQERNVVSSYFDIWEDDLTIVHEQRNIHEIKNYLNEKLH